MTTTPEAQSASTQARSSRMTLVGEKRLPEAEPTLPQNPSLSQIVTGSRENLTPTTTPTAQLSQEYIHRAAWKAGVMGALNVATAILAVRLTLLVSVCGAIALSVLALHDPDPYRLGALGAYAVLVVVPLVWLAGRR